jgi:hypothetical protein
MRIETLLVEWADDPNGKIDEGNVHKLGKNEIVSVQVPFLEFLIFIFAELIYGIRSALSPPAQRSLKGAYQSWT